MADNALQKMVEEYLRVTGGPGEVQTGGTSSSSLLEFFRWAGVTGPRPSPATNVPASPAGVLQTHAQAMLPTVVAQSGGGSIASSIEKTLLKTFTSGLGLVPLVSGLLGLFGGGKHEEPPALTKFALPPALHIEAANSRSGELPFVDYGQGGTPRTWSGVSNREGEILRESNAAGDPSTASQTPSAAPQITIQVQAMDSRSFLDHSQDIAQAVREAMLNMHSLNDVVSDL